MEKDKLEVRFYQEELEISNQSIEIRDKEDFRDVGCITG